MSNETPAPPKGSKKTWLIFAVLALVAVGAGAVLPWVFGAHAKDAHTQSKKGDAPKTKNTAIPFDDVVVNLGEVKFSRFLRVKLMIAVDETDAREATELITQQKAFLKSWLICYLSEQASPELTRRASVNRIRREICDQFNLMLYPTSEGKIVDILFDMFVVQ